MSVVLGGGGSPVQEVSGAAQPTALSAPPGAVDVSSTAALEIPGPQGPQGPTGSPGQPRWAGEGPPGTIIGAQPGDAYLDTLTGNLYQLT